MVKAHSQQMKMKDAENKSCEHMMHNVSLEPLQETLLTSGVVF